MRVAAMQFHSSNVFQAVPYGPEVAMRYRVKFGKAEIVAYGWQEALDVACALTCCDRDRIETDGVWIDHDTFVGGHGPGEFTIEAEDD